MKTLIAILILSAFLQTTIFPFDLTLIILLLRTLIKPSKSNLYLAFLTGLLVSHLSSAPLGLYSFIYLLLVQLGLILAKSRFSNHMLIIYIEVTAFLVIENLSLSLFVGQSVMLWPKVFVESLLTLPIYIVLRLYEERFVINKEIRLRA